MHEQDSCEEHTPDHDDTCDERPQLELPARVWTFAIARNNPPLSSL